MTAQTESKTKEKPPESRSAYTPPKVNYGADRYGHAILIHGNFDFRSAMPDERTARFFAAAPALYEALADLSITLETIDASTAGLNSGLAFEINKSVRKAAKQARAALALVKGGQ